uniref:Acyl-CoA thioesterase II n=1 Tax=Caenorhabditis japonica TaxID=281687 RepID=A0A8R1DIJ1_CAEJA
MSLSTSPPPDAQSHTSQHALMPRRMEGTEQNSLQYPMLLNVTHIDMTSRADHIQAGLVDTFLNLERVDKNLYLARHLLKGRNSIPVVYGGQVIGQALSAATATVDFGFVPNSLHSYFVQSGNVNRPILYQVDRIRDGKSFCTRLVKAVQDGEAIFTVQISFHRSEPDSIVHQLPMPEVPAPDSLEDLSDTFDRIKKNPNLPPAALAMIAFKQKEIPPAFFRIFSFRPVDIDSYLCLKKDDVHSAGHGHPTDAYRSYVWIKANERVGDDPRLHLAAAAYISDATMIETALRPHSKRGFIPSMALTLDHSIWMHTDNFRVDDWLLYENHSTVASGGRSLIEGKLWTRDGRLVFSTTQEALIRAHKKSPPTPAK